MEKEETAEYIQNLEEERDLLYQRVVDLEGSIYSVVLDLYGEVGTVDKMTAVQNIRGKLEALLPPRDDIKYNE